MLGGGVCVLNPKISSPLVPPSTCISAEDSLLGLTFRATTRRRMESLDWISKRFWNSGASCWVLIGFPSRG